MRDTEEEKEEENRKEYKSSITGCTVKVYPTMDDWRMLLKEAGKTGPHWDWNKIKIFRKGEH